MATNTQGLKTLRRFIVTSPRVIPTPNSHCGKHIETSICLTPAHRKVGRLLQRLLRDYVDISLQCGLVSTCADDITLNA